MKRFLAMGGVLLALLLVVWFVRGGGGDESRRPGSSRAKSDAPALRWAGGAGGEEEGDRELTPVEGEIRGRVVDAIDSSPIADATVTLRSRGGDALDETSASADGVFSFDESGDAEMVVAAAPGYAMQAKAIVGGEIVLEMDGAVTIAGIVVDPGGDPVRDAEVWISDRERVFFDPPVVSSTARTDAAGRFVVEDAPSGTLIAHAEHEDFASATLELGGFGPGRRKEDVRIELGDTGVLFGRVVDESGASVGGAVMTWVPEDQRLREHDATSISGADGRFRFPKLAAGRGLVRATSTGLDGAADAEVVVGADVSVDVVVDLLPRLIGMVVDAAGAPVAGATVSITRSVPSWSNRDALRRAQRQRGDVWSVVTDSDGGFDLNAPSNEVVTLYGRTETASGSLTAEPGDGPLVIRLEALGIARVRVVGGDGKPYAGSARVSVESGSVTGGRWGKNQQLQENGTATFEGAVGEWRIRVLVGDGAEDGDEADHDDDDDEGPAPLREGEVLVQVGPAPPVTDVTVRLAGALVARSVVRGRIAGPDGAAVVGARVSVLAGGRDRGGSSGARLDWRGSLRSDSGGRFALEVLPGTQKLFVYHPEYRSEIATVVVPAQGATDAGVIRLETGTGASAVYEFSGIGAVLAVDDAGRCIIQDVVANGPAQRAGLRAKDVVLEVDGTTLHGMGLGDVIGRIRGPVGTTVTLRIERAGNLESFLVDVVRDKIRA